MSDHPDDNFDSGYYCPHWAGVNDCLRPCTCGHPCKDHDLDRDSHPCRIEDCPCASFEDVP